MRVLYHAPILHNFADEGLPRSAPWMNRAEIFWDVLEKSIEQIEFSWRSVIIYQDTQIFSSADAHLMRTHHTQAQKGSRNSQLILRLLDCGAWLEKTEHHKLLGLKDLHTTELTEAEKNLRRKTTSPDEIDEQRALKDHIMLLRDRYIAHRINRTLQETKTGLLLLGASHRRFLSYLAPDIEVRYVLSKEDYNRFLLFLYERKD